MYNTRSFSKRFESLGDTAESAFETYASKNEIQFARYGFNRPPLTKFPFVSAFVRFTPDYLAQYNKKLFFCEVKGTSKNDFKLKLKQIEQLLLWHTHEPVVFFVFNSAQKKTTFINITQTLDIINTQQLPVEVFANDGNEYYSVPLAWDTSIEAVL